MILEVYRSNLKQLWKCWFRNSCNLYMTVVCLFGIRTIWNVDVIIFTCIYIYIYICIVIFIFIFVIYLFSFLITWKCCVYIYIYVYVCIYLSILYNRRSPNIAVTRYHSKRNATDSVRRFWCNAHNNRRPNRPEATSRKQRVGCVQTSTMIQRAS